MFYSHEILTSRRHGVATVWLVATLGSKSTSKKVNKKAILDVDIPKACGVIIQPEAPMALRLQSNLLCGVTRVFSQQCGYALIDAQNIEAQMRQLIRNVQRGVHDLDLETGRAARPEQLLLPDDPNFLPELTLDVDLDLANLNFDTDPSSQSASVLSPRSRRSSRTSHSEMPELQVPSSTGHGYGLGLGDFAMGDVGTDARGSLHGYGMKHTDQLDARDEEILPEADFAFDQDGNIFEIDAPSQTGRSSQLAAPLRSRDVNAVSTPLDMGGEISRGQQAHDQDVQPIDLDDINVAEESLGFPQALSSPRQATDEVRTSSTETEGEEGSVYGVQATMARKPRKAKPLPIDKTLEIRNTELLSWSTNYLTNMAELRKKKEAAKVASQSRKNADWIVWGAGLGGIGHEVHAMRGMKHPLDMFCGQNLKEMLVGEKANGRKRERVEGSDDDSEARRVRQRSQEYGRGGEDEAGFDIRDMDFDEPLEIGRRAPTPARGIPSTDDVSSAMPWNRSDPFRSSSIARGIDQRAGSQSYISGLPSTGERRRGLTSASPLIGRGIQRSRTHSRQRSLQLPGRLPSAAGFSSSVQGISPRQSVGPFAGDDADADIPYEEGSARAAQDEFDLFGAAAAVDTQTAGGSQWLRRQLDAESGNFLAFVATAVDQRGEDTADVDADIDALGKDGKNSKRAIAFETLLKPEENTHVVAAQGLLHVLTLATRGLLWVEQDESVFGGELRMGVTGAGFERVTANAVAADDAARMGVGNPVEVEQEV